MIKLLKKKKRKKDERNKTKHSSTFQEIERRRRRDDGPGVTKGVVGGCRHPPSGPTYCPARYL